MILDRADLDSSEGNIRLMMTWFDHIENYTKRAGRILPRAESEARKRVCAVSNITWSAKGLEYDKVYITERQ